MTEKLHKAKDGSWYAREQADKRRKRLGWWDIPTHHLLEINGFFFGTFFDLDLVVDAAGMCPFINCLSKTMSPPSFMGTTTSSSNKKRMASFTR